MGQHISRFIYGTEYLGRETGYDAFEEYDNNNMVDESSYCNNDCLNCVLECPYKEY